jgi:glyoxylase-like metal-dependent hydrolase (beta-lactamase superfamily II)
MLGGEASPEADQLLNEGDLIRFGSQQLKVLHTPGHSPGGICLEGYGLLFSGDTLFAGSVGRTDLPGSDHDGMFRSIENRLMVLPDETAVLTGHGPATTIRDERAFNPFLRGAWR